MRGTRETPLGQAECNLKTRTGACACDMCPTPRPDPACMSQGAWHPRGRGGVEGRGSPHSKRLEQQQEEVRLD